MKHLDFMASDHAYFKKNRGSKYRIRRIMPGEAELWKNGNVTAEQRAEIEACMVDITHVVVCHMGPGLRARKFVTLPEIPGHKWSEEDARTLWEEGRLPEPPRAPVVPMRGGRQQ